MPTPIKAYLGTVPLFDNGQSSVGYQRPTDWLTLPAAPADGFTGLHAVFDQQENYVTVRMITNDASSYTINWGDGNTTTAASNAVIEYNYSFSNPLLDNTLTPEGYKQAIITVTPAVGKSFTFCSVANRATTPPGQSVYSSGWLDINFNLPNLIIGLRLQIGSGSNTVRHSYLQRVNIKSWGNITNLTSLFTNCQGLQSLNETEWDMSNITAINGMFYSCISLRNLDCSGWDTSKVTTMQNAFVFCHSLLDTKCSNWDTGNCNSFNGMFRSCSSLTYLDLSNWDTSSVTDISLMFNLCSNLRYVKMTGWNTNLLTQAQNVFTNCFSLQKIDPFNVSAVTSFGNNFCTNCNSLTEVGLTNIDADIILQSCRLGALALNDIYTNLSNTGTGKIITVTNNYGTTTDDPSIATAKGWTVVG